MNGRPRETEREVSRGRSSGWTFAGKVYQPLLGAEMSNVITEIDDPVAIVRLNRPEKLNAFTFAMIEEIRAALNRAAADAGVVGIVITGDGRAFSAGLDSVDFGRSTQADSPPPQTPPEPGELPALFSYLPRIPKPVIAAV